MRTQEQVNEIVRLLMAEYPLADCTLDWNKAYELLFSVRLAAQCTDERVNKITPALFARFPTLEAFAEADVAEVEEYVRSCGFYHSKARDIVACANVLLEKYGGPTPQGMVESALGHARLLEKYGFDDLVLSIKASNARATVEANRLASKACDYPLHIGVTEAGSPGMGTIKSAVGIGALLVDGIGDTVRVSLSGDPVNEVYAAKEILKAAGVLNEGVDIISCPTCGRTQIPVAEIAEKVRLATQNLRVPLKVAVMGCIVNGPGEAREADIGIAGGKDGGALFVKGEKPRAVRGDLAEILIHEINERYGN